MIDSGDVKEEFVSVILPHLSRGMKSEVGEYKAASYMILAQLLHSTKLKSDILKTVQQILTKVNRSPFFTYQTFSNEKYYPGKCILE